MKEAISARRVRQLIGTLPKGPIHARLAETLTLLIGDGRIPLAVRLPSERELAAALKVSRTTVTRAYATLCDNHYARATQGSGTFTSVPGGRERAHDRVLVAGRASGGGIDLSCAADSAPPGIVAAYTAALQELPAYLGGHGYFPSGLPTLQEAIAATYQARGLSTAPEQIAVTPGALTAASVTVRALALHRGHALVESPTYPNATEMFRAAGMQLHEVPMDASGWDIPSILDSVRQVRPDIAYLIPDFQNPTGAVMTAEQRKRLGAHLNACGTIPIVDETHQALALDGRRMPLPFAAFNPDTFTLGSMSKAFWGGLRVGWVRVPHAFVERITRARMSLDLGVPVVEQLVAAHLLRQGPVSSTHLERLRTQRDALVGAVTAHLPDWRFVPPTGGLTLWCELPCQGATALAAAVAGNGIFLSPGPVFSPSGGLDSFVRLPWTRSVPELEEAVVRIAAAWRRIEGQGHAITQVSTHRRVVIA